jgi:deleted-in-malignant-brain-tumors protein 1
VLLSVLCQDRDIRLVGGDSYGRIEVCSNGLWGAICGDEFWNDHSARAVCNQLGFSQYGKIVIYHIIVYCVLR